MKIKRRKIMPLQLTDEEKVQGALEVARVAGLHGDRATRYATGVLAVDLKVSPSAARALILNATTARGGPAQRDMMEPTMRPTTDEAPAALISLGETEEATMSDPGKKRAKKAPAKAAVKRAETARGARGAKAGKGKGAGTPKRVAAAGPRPGTISALVVELARAGKDNETIAKACAKQFPKKESVTVAAVAWYRWNAVKKGWLKK